MTIVTPGTIFQTGLAADLPSTPRFAGDVFYTTDTGAIYVSNAGGTAWKECSPDTVRRSRWSYDFAVDGGAIGTISLRSSSNAIPIRAVIVNAYVYVITALTSGGAATVGTHVNAANDIVSDTAIGGAPWSSTGLKLGISDYATVGDAKETTAARTPAMVIATADLTAGKFDVILDYFVRNAA